MIYANIYAEDRVNNSLFESEDTLHKFNPTSFPRELRQAFFEMGIEINTPDLNANKDISFDLYLEGQKVFENARPKFLLALENPYINSFNHDELFCSQFVQIFTWNAKLLKLPNAVYILYPHAFKVERFQNFSEKNIFSCLINANKAFKYVLPADLYLERLKTIRWYEKNALDKFQLYGLGWDKSPPAFNIFGKLMRIIPRFKTKFFGHKPYPSFRGEIANKADVLKLSKYSYCYENSKELTNYVTEKIFDSLVCGCIPIYWGSDNVNDLIPSSCFIDRRKFKDTAAVHKYLLSISATRYTEYQHQILKFLNSDAAKKFDAKRIANVIAKRIAEYVVIPSKI